MSTEFNAPATPIGVRLNAPPPPITARRFIEFILRFAEDGIRAQVTNETRIESNPRQDEFDDTKRRLLARFPWMGLLRHPLRNVTVTYLDDVAKMTKANATAILRASGIAERGVSPVLNRKRAMTGETPLSAIGFDASRLQIVRSRRPRSG